MSGGPDTPWVRFLESGGREGVLRPGELIGRHRRAHLQLLDPDLAPFHGLVAVRGGALRLLSLARPLEVDGKPHGALNLEVGQCIALSNHQKLTVLAVGPPTRALGIEGPSLPFCRIDGVTSLVDGPRLTLRPGHDPAASAWLWPDGDGLVARIGEESPRHLAPGDRLKIGSHEIEVHARPITRAERTTRDDARPLHVCLSFDVAIVTERGHQCRLTGLAALLLTVLHDAGGRVPWGELVARLWPERQPGSRADARAPLDKLVARIRTSLRSAGVLRELLCWNGAGELILVLGPDDRVEDQQ